MMVSFSLLSFPSLLDTLSVSASLSLSSVNSVLTSSLRTFHFYPARSQGPSWLVLQDPLWIPALSQSASVLPSHTRKINIFRYLVNLPSVGTRLCQRKVERETVFDCSQEQVWAQSLFPLKTYSHRVHQKTYPLG